MWYTQAKNGSYESIEVVDLFTFISYNFETISFISSYGILSFFTKSFSNIFDSFYTSALFFHIIGPYFETNALKW